MKTLRLGLPCVFFTLASTVSGAAETGDDATAPAPGDPIQAQPPAEGVDAAQAAADRAPHSRLIEEIVVTAQKREEMIEDVPISVQAFSAEKLDALGIDSQGGLQNITPTLTVGNQAGYVVTFLRGVGSDAFLTSDPSVTTYIDGVYFPFAYNLGTDLGGVERIEVLKGPQGTLFGRNSTGGAINIVTADPKLGESTSELQASYGSYSDLQTRASTSVPLGRFAAISASGFYNLRDNYYSGRVAGKPLGHDWSKGARVKVLLQPMDDLSLVVAGVGQRSGGLGTHYACISHASLLAQVTLAEPSSGLHCDNDARIYTSGDTRFAYGHLDYASPWATFKLIGSDQHIQGPGTNDFDGSPTPIVEFTASDQRIKAKSWEAQILSNGEWGPDWLQWIVGANTYKSEGGFRNLQLRLAGTSLEQGTTLGLELPPGLLDLIELFGPVPTGDVGLVAMVGTKSRAVFGQATVSLTDWLAITLGARQQTEKRRIIESSAGVLTESGERIVYQDYDTARNTTTGETVPGKTSTKSFNPKATIELRPWGDDTLLYASYQRAVKGATYNVVAIYTPPSFVKPEKIRATEVGLKSRFFDGLVQVNAAVFNYEITNLQSQFISLFEGGAISFHNVGKARSYGVDVDGSVILFPNWVDNLVVTGGAAWLHARYKDFPDGSGYDDQTGLYERGQDYSGNTMVRSPTVTVALAMSKTWELFGHPLEVAVDTYHTSRQYFESSNRDVASQKAYTVLGARVSYLFDPWSLRTTVFCRNLTDEVYAQGMFSSDWGPKPNYAEPRVFGIKMQLSF